MRNESQVLNVWYLISNTEKSNSGQEVKDMLPKRSVKKHHALHQYDPSNNIMNFAIESKFLVVEILNSRVQEKLGSLYPTSLDFTILHSIYKQVFIFIFNMYNWEGCKNSDCRITSVFSINTLTSVCTFSILHSIHFLRRWQGEVLKQSRASLVCDHFLYSLNLNEGFSGGIVRRN